ncbi:MAG TPA: hypothetical protein VK909_24440 [Anaerolineales bacterium]|nr:hypothetical protein [Anaerolineales bacterium]
MKEQLLPKQLELYQGIDEILWNDWDPIGINLLPSSRDEYQDYIPVIFNLVMKNVTSLELEQYLDDVVKNRMGLRSSKKSNKPVAEKIIELKNQLGL